MNFLGGPQGRNVAKQGVLSGKLLMDILFCILNICNSLFYYRALGEVKNLSLGCDIQ